MSWYLILTRCSCCPILQTFNLQPGVSIMDMISLVFPLLQGRTAAQVGARGACAIALVRSRVRALRACVHWHTRGAKARHAAVEPLVQPIRAAQPAANCKFSAAKNRRHWPRDSAAPFGDREAQRRGLAHSAICQCGSSDPPAGWAPDPPSTHTRY
jgi:hypothetical protein